MPLVFATIAPHGGEIVPQLTDDLALMGKTRAAMQELGRRFAAQKIDTVIGVGRSIFRGRESGRVLADDHPRRGAGPHPTHRRATLLRSPNLLWNGGSQL